MCCCYSLCMQLFPKALTSKPFRDGFLKDYCRNILVFPDPAGERERMSVNLIQASYEELRSWPQISHASVTHIIDIGNECNLQKVPFTFRDLAGKPTIQTNIATLLRGGKCFFEGQPLPFELDDTSDDGYAVGDVATTDDTDSQTQGNQPSKSPKSASQKKLRKKSPKQSSTTSSHVFVFLNTFIRIKAGISAASCLKEFVSF